MGIGHCNLQAVCYAPLGYSSFGICILRPADRGLGVCRLNHVCKKAQIMEESHKLRGFVPGTLLPFLLVQGLFLLSYMVEHEENNTDNTYNTIRNTYYT